MIDQSERSSNAPGILQKIYNSKKLMALTFTVAFAVIGTVTLLLTRAAAPSSSVELESGTLTSPAVVGSDTNASGGKYVQYGTAVSTTPTPPPTGGTVYYVDCTGGSDSNAGTSQAAAWKTLSKANAAALASGNGLLFKRGCSFGSGLVIKWSGVTVGNYGSGSLPVFSTTSTNGNIITITGSNNTVDGLQVMGPDTVTASGDGVRGGIAGISVQPGSSNNTIQNSTISGNYAGIFVRQDAINNRILRNTIKDNRLLDTAGGAGAFGILIWGHNNQVSYNSFSGNFADSALYPPYDGSSVEIYTSNGNTAASNNTISYNTSVNDNAFSELGKGNTAAIPDNNIFAYNSYVASGQGNALFVNTRGTSADGYGPVTNTKVYNNSVYVTGANKAAALICQGTCSASALVYQNNILISSAGGTSVGGASGSNNITNATDAAYVGAPNDLHLQAGSKAINAGTSTALSAGFNKDLDGKNVPAGSAVDIGAYEFGSVAYVGGSTKNFAPVTIVKRIVAVAVKQNPLFHFIHSLSRGLASAAQSVSSVLGKTYASIFKTEKALAVQPNGSITIAAVGDMNPSGNTSTTSASGKNAAAISAGLANGSLDAFFGLGDFQYDTGTCSSLVNSWGKLWGSVIPKTYTIAGPTHDMASATDEMGHRQFFNGQCPGSTAKSAAVTAKGTSIGPGDFYSFDIGNWHFAALPTTLWRFNTTKANQVTTQLDSDLAAAKAAGKFLVALYHDPYFTSSTSSHNREAADKPWIDVMDKYGMRFTLSGSQHNYERSCPVLKNDACTTDNGAGMIAFNVSTGGIGLRGFTSAPSYIVKRFSDTWGWLKLTLNIDGSFSWVFNPVSGTGTDSGSRVGPGGGPVPAPPPTPTPDTTPPTASINAPAANAVLSGTVNVTATASDNVGVGKVEFYVDGALKATDTSSPYNFSLDTATLANSSHTLKAIAYDTAPTPNQTSSSLVVSVNNGCAALSAPYGQVTVPVNVPQNGTYRIWSRIMAPDSTNNSYTFQTDGVCGLTIGDSAVAANTWTWVNHKNGSPATPADVTLAAGSHTLLLAGREVGVKLDRVILLLSTDTCVPTGTGDNCTTAPDSTPPTVSISAPTSGSIKSPVTVTATASDTGGSGLDRVEFSVDGVLQNTILNPGPFTWTWNTTATGNHNLSAKAFDKAGNASTISSVNVTVQDTTKPTVSINTPATGATVSGSQVAVTAGTTDNVGVTSVSLMIDNASVPYQTLAGNTTGAYGFTWDASNVTSGNHTLQVQAKDAAGNVGTSANVTVTVSNDTTPPSQPTNLTATAISATQVDLSWTGSTDNTGVTGYIIQRNSVNIAQATGTTYNDTSVSAASPYSYTIVAKDAAGNQSQPSTAASVTTPAVSTDKTPPTTPQNLQAQAVSQNQVSLSWDASTDSGGSGLKGYNVLRNGVKIATVDMPVKQITTVFFDDGTTQATTTYTYTVTAFDGAGNVSSPSNQAKTTTPASPVPASDTSPPTATISSPTTDQTVSAQSNVSASVNDNIGVARAVLLVDGTERAQILNPSRGSITLSWQTTVVPDGSHTLLVRVVDAAGNVGNSDAVTLTVQNNNTSAPGSTKKLTFSVAADAGLKKSRPTTNFGTTRTMSVDSRPKEKMVMKFNVTGVTGKVTKAVIRLYDVNGSKMGGSFYRIANNWSEKSINWNNAPYFYSNSPVAKLGKVKKSTYIEIPVTGVVKTNGTYSFGGRSDSSDAAGYSTKEDSNSTRRPQLIITEGVTGEKFDD